MSLAFKEGCARASSLLPGAGMFSSPTAQSISCSLFTSRSPYPRLFTLDSLSSPLAFLQFFSRVQMTAVVLAPPPLRLQALAIHHDLAGWSDY